MNKAIRCLLHIRCIARKGLRGRRFGWHWQHLLRELGLGVYSAAARRQENPDRNDRPCYT